MGTLLRLGMVGFGGFMLFGGINEAFNGERVNDTPKAVSPSEAASLAHTGGKAYYTVNAGVDVENAIFETGLSNPRYTQLPSDQVFELPNSMGTFGGDNYAEYNGGLVQHNAPLLPMRVILESISVEHGKSTNEGTLTGIRVIATSAEHPGRLFVVSPFFYDEQDPAYTAWLAEGSYWGRLCKVSEADSNVKTEKNFQQVLDLYRDNGMPADSGGYVLLSQKGSPKGYESAGYAPLIGPSSSVLVRFDNTSRSAMGTSVTGVASSRTSKSMPGVGFHFPGFSDRFVVIDSTITGTEINDATSAAAKAGIIVGAFFLALGGFLFWHAGKRRQRVEQELVMLQQQMYDQMSRLNEEPKQGSDRYAA